MKLEQSFDVRAPIDRVWAALVDVEHVAPCLPGAAVTGRNEDGSYSGTFTIKIGPTTASYNGRLEMETVDEQAHRATMQAQGTDRRGQGGAKATIVSTLSAANGGTRVQVITDYHITGRLARFGRGGMIEDISERLLREFAARLQSSLAEPEPAAVPAAVRVGEQPTEELAHLDEAAEAPPAPEAPRPAEASSEIVPPPTDAGPSAGPPPPPPAAPHPPIEPAPPIEGLSLVGSVMVDRVRRNPKPLLGLLGLLVLLRLLRRRR